MLDPDKSSGNSVYEITHLCLSSEYLIGLSCWIIFKDEKVYKEMASNTLNYTCHFELEKL